MKAVRAALDNNPVAFGGAGFESSLAQWVALYAKDTAVARGTASLAWSDKGTDRQNNDGVTTPEGFSGGVSANGRWEPFPYLTAHAKGAAWFGTGGEDNVLLGDTAVEFGHKYISLQAGMISTWYGPGRRGALIYTNNAQPYPGLRLHNPVPIPMPWIFSFLGTFQYDMFLAQLADDRPIPNSRLFGMRLAFRPSVFLEIGVSRAMQYGGKGQNNGFDAWWDAFTAKDLNQQVEGVLENELAGFDVEVTLPFRVQPVQLYFEMAGEDQHPSTVPYPTKYAYLGGIFLPAILGNPSFDLRFEYSDNHSDGNGPVWYVHPTYPHSHEGRILGHPMGTDARDIFVEGHWFFLPSTYLALNWTWTTNYNGSGGSGDAPYVHGVKEETNRIGASFVGWFTKSVRMEALIDAVRVTNQGGTPGKDESDFRIGVALSWQYPGS
jgi:hypothetical protein